MPGTAGSKANRSCSAPGSASAPISRPVLVVVSSLFRLPRAAYTRSIASSRSETGSVLARAARGGRRRRRILQFAQVVWPAEPAHLVEDEVASLRDIGRGRVRPEGDRVGQYRGQRRGLVAA